MSRRSLIGEALASVPAPAPDTPPPAAEATTPRSSFTSKRLEAFGEAARMVKRPTIRLKPSECSIWPGNARDYARLDEGRLRSLIDSILAEGGNRVPVVIRRTPQGDKPYELITGTRRHWAISWLNEHHYPDIELVAIIEDLDDEAAFRLADIENREREDISDLERGRNYKAAVEAYYGGVQLRMAERLRISKSTLARYIQLTDLPDVIVGAFHSPMDLHIKYGEKLVPALKNPAACARMEEAARSVAEEQRSRQSGGGEPIPGNEVVARLMAACVKRVVRPSKSALLTAGGILVGQVDRDQKQALTITISAPDLPTDEILEALRPAIERARMRRSGRG